MISIACVGQIDKFIRLLAGIVSICLISFSSYATEFSVNAVMVPKESIKMNFADSSKHFVLKGAPGRHG